MEKLFNLDLFTQVQSDFEFRQYKVLAALKKIKQEFQKNKIYPYLGQMVELFNSLKKLLERIENLREEFPQMIKKIDLVNKKIEHEPVYVDPANLENVENFIKWALPHIKSTIDEGTSIYDYVDEHIEMEKVGIIPNYREEGYFFVPDNEIQQLNLFQFEVTIFHSSKDKYRALKTELLKNIDRSTVLRSPNEIKLDLIREYKKLPNPATYSFEIELAFPFNETVLPIVKRKLLRHLYN